MFQESDTTWQGQPGGCEGLRQKGWTSVIVSALAANQYETGLHSHIIGQGDNQVIVVSVPVPITGVSSTDYLRDYPEEITKVIKMYLENLKN